MVGNDRLNVPAIDTFSHWFGGPPERGGRGGVRALHVRRAVVLLKGGGGGGYVRCMCAARWSS